MQTFVQIICIAKVRTLRVFQKLFWYLRIGWVGNVLTPRKLEDLRFETKHLYKVWLERYEDLSLNTQHLCKIKKQVFLYTDCNCSSVDQR